MTVSDWKSATWKSVLRSLLSIIYKCLDETVGDMITSLHITKVDPGYSTAQLESCAEQWQMEFNLDLK